MKDGKGIRKGHEDMSSKGQDKRQKERTRDRWKGQETEGKDDIWNNKEGDMVTKKHYRMLFFLTMYNRYIGIV